MRRALLIAALMAATVAAVPVNKCTWSLGVCNTSPGAVLTAVGGAQPAFPMFEGMVRSLALDAACNSHPDERSCKADTVAALCLWDTKLTPSCFADPEKSSDALQAMPVLAGCPGSISAAVDICGAASTQDTCAHAAAKCTWLDAASLPASTSTARISNPNRRRLQSLIKGNILHGSSESGQEGMVGPSGEPLKGCVPAEFASRALAGDADGIEELNAGIDAGDYEVYGDCEAASDDLFDKCADAATKKDCMAKKPDCDWDAEGTECYVSQAAILASILGDSHKAVADAKACHALTTAAACTGAGKLQYDIRLSKGYLAKHVTGAAPKTV